MIADDLGSWAAELRFDDLGEHAIHTVRQRLVDSLGCGLGAFNAEPSRAARRLARALPPGPWRPTTRETADHSLPYTVARVLDEIWNVDLAPTVTTPTNALILLPRPEREIP
ncbi:MmgE/PrpD family protein [Nonomuraea jabiensis]|uniref:MmgE/PrpD family protein n=1 Tax=Nonomuraea jabiensis TaxID=882448 RepID=UPI0034262406